MANLVLVPWPRQMRTLGTGAPASATVTESHVEGLPPQGFELEITADTVALRYRDRAGQRYGHALLGQIRAQSNGRLPGLSVRDWPDFPVRGYMLDVSRGRVPTRETLAWIVELLGMVRINHLQLYTEHTFAYTDHEVVWRGASPLTPADIRWLDERCTAAGIELAANQNTFGHMERWLAHDKYRYRAEVPEGFELFGQHRRASTLAPTTDNADFALGLLDELLPNFESRRVNIGCDETWELGRGVSSPDVDARGKGRVYLDHLQRLLVPLLEKGYEPQFWGDIVAREPELLSGLPSGAVTVAWNYQAPVPPDERPVWPEHIARGLRQAGLDFNRLMEGFAPIVTPFAEAGCPFWVAPGTSSWCSLIGRVDNAIGNLADAAEVGRRMGAGGYLITDWGDLGHLQPPSVSAGPVVYGAAVSWAFEANLHLPLAQVLDTLIFNDTTATLGTTLDVLGRVWRRTGQVAHNASPLQAAVVPGRYQLFGDPDVDQLSGVIADLDTALNEIDQSSPSVGDAELIKRELTAATRLARHGAWRLVREAGGPTLPDDALAADLSEAVALHREAWLARSRPGGLEIGMSALATTAHSYQSQPGD